MMCRPYVLIELAKIFCVCTERCRKWGKEKPQLKYIKPNICGIGYNLDGSFDPNHVDYGVCLNCFHINV